jgi:hypothetical protein
MDTNPFPCRADRDRASDVATGLSDPSLTLIENGPAVGILLGEGCHEDSYSGRLFLDRVTWARGDESVRALRDFAGVCLYATQPGVWVAEEVGTGRLFPRPSNLPYHVLFISGEDYQNLMHRRMDRDGAAILAYARSRFSTLPGFQLQGERLLSPKGYAMAAARFPAREFVSEGETA